VDVGGHAVFAVRLIPVLVQMVGVRLGAVAMFGIGQADALRDAVRSRELTEIAVERAVLLHYHYHVLDLVNASGGRSNNGGKVPQSGLRPDIRPGGESGGDRQRWASY